MTARPSRSAARTVSPPSGSNAKAGTGLLSSRLVFASVWDRCRPGREHDRRTRRRGPRRQWRYTGRVLHTGTSSRSCGACASIGASASPVPAQGCGVCAGGRDERDDRAERHHPPTDPEPDHHRVHRDAERHAAALVRRRDQREVDVAQEARCAPTACRCRCSRSGTSRSPARRRRASSPPCSIRTRAETVVFWPLRSVSRPRYVTRVARDRRRLAAARDEPHVRVDELPEAASATAISTTPKWTTSPP